MSSSGGQRIWSWTKQGSPHWFRGVGRTCNRNKDPLVELSGGKFAMLTLLRICSPPLSRSLSPSLSSPCLSFSLALFLLPPALCHSLSPSLSLLPSSLSLSPSRSLSSLPPSPSHFLSLFPPFLSLPLSLGSVGLRVDLGPSPVALYRRSAEIN